MLHTTPLALFNLADNKAKTIVATTGVAFAVALLFMQIGFFSAVRRVAVTVYANLDFDLVLTSPHYVSLPEAGSFPRPRLDQALGIRGVRSAKPIQASRMMWTNLVTSQRRYVVLLAIDPTDHVFLDDEIDRQQHALLYGQTVLVDRLSRPELGPLAAGTVTQVGALTMRIVGQFDLGPGFEPGLALTSDRTYSRLFNRGQLYGHVAVGLVRIEPDMDRDEVADALRRQLPADVQVRTREQILADEQKYWVTSTSTGIIFGSGVIVASVFGVVIVCQVLSTDISVRLSEYATLKALGYSDASIAWIILQQAIVFAVLGYIPAVLMAVALCSLTEAMTNLPVYITASQAAMVFAATLACCSLSALLSVRAVRSADPTDLFSA